MLAILLLLGSLAVSLLPTLWAIAVVAAVPQQRVLSRVFELRKLQQPVAAYVLVSEALLIVAILVVRSYSLRIA